MREENAGATNIEATIAGITSRKKDTYYWLSRSILGACFKKGLCQGTDLQAAEKVLACEDLYQGTSLQVAEKLCFLVISDA